MKPKDLIYQRLISQLEDTYNKGYYFESAWLEYVILEDRLVSILKSSGGHLTDKGKEIKMLGPKLEKLNERYASNTILKNQIDRDDIFNRIIVWKDSRNTLMHSMADGTLTIEQIDNNIKELAEKGVLLVRHTAATARRIKKLKKSGNL